MTLERIRKAWSDHVFAGLGDPTVVVISRESWWSLCQEEGLVTFLYVPDSANNIKIMGMSLFLAPVDDEVFVA